MAFNYLSVCSGIEAASVAWHPIGWNCVGVAEIEPFPSAVLAHHYPKVPNFGDMTKFKEWKINETIDLLVGGPPCQSFSVAGLRQGLKDPRGNLTISYLSLVEHFKPKWIVFENVPGLLSSDSGKDFGSFLGGLAELGYGFAYRVLDAQWIRTHRHPRAVPQRRRRVFVVGCFGNPTSAAKVLFKQESLHRYSAPRRATREETAGDVEEGVGSCEKLVADVATVDARNNFDRGDSQHLDRLIPCWWDGENTASTLTKSNANGAQRMPDKDNFGAVLHPVAMAAFTKSKRAQSKTDNETWVKGVVAPTQNAFDVGDVRATTVAIQGNVIGRQDHNGPQGSGYSDSGEMFTLNSTDVHALAVPQCYPLKQPNDITFKESRRQNGIGKDGDPAFTLRSALPPGVVTSMQVRRLTPTECERLQGFPDGWTLIPWKKKPADQCPDGPRYKALGNSMAVNCMEWLGERIQAVENGVL